MAEYIEREQVKDELLSWAVCINHPEHLLKEDALCVIDAIPAADVVPVVRCEYCTCWKETFVNSKGFRICPASGMDITENDFCSYGERKSDGT